MGRKRVYYFVVIWWKFLCSAPDYAFKINGGIVGSGTLGIAILFGKFSGNLRLDTPIPSTFNYYNTRFYIVYIRKFSRWYRNFCPPKIFSAEILSDKVHKWSLILFFSAPYSENLEWKLISPTAKRHEVKYVCCPNIYPDVTFYINFQRKSMFYVLNLIFPIAMITILTIVSFILPQESGTLFVSIFARINFCHTNSQIRSLVWSPCPGRWKMKSSVLAEKIFSLAQQFLSKWLWVVFFLIEATVTEG